MAELFKKITFIVVPLVNPDGYEECLQKNRGTKKTNARGVDINRNFPYKYWGSRITKPGNGYPGPQPGSEPETQAIISLIGTHEFALCVDIHSRGRLLFCQKGGLTAEDIANGRSPDELNAISQTLAQTLRLQVNYRIVGEAKIVFGDEGTLTDYAFSQGIPTITFETLKGGTRQPASSKLIKSEYAYFNWPNAFCEIGLFAAGLE
jgi:predicted deacylase